MDKLLRAAIMAFAGLFAMGMVSFAPAAAAGSDDRQAKREDGPAQVVTVDEDDADDDTGNTGNTGYNSGTGNSNDGTNSRHTAVSRYRDISQGDLTKDWTRDGGDRTRDHSRNYTNDSSRNDTR